MDSAADSTVDGVDIDSVSATRCGHRCMNVQRHCAPVLPRRYGAQRHIATRLLHLGIPATRNSCMCYRVYRLLSVCSRFVRERLANWNKLGKDCSRQLLSVASIERMLLKFLTRCPECRANEWKIRMVSVGDNFFYVKRGAFICLFVSRSRDSVSEFSSVSTCLPTESSVFGI